MEPAAISFVTRDSEDTAGTSGTDSRTVRVIIPRSRAYLAPLLATAFTGRRDVEVVVASPPREPEADQGPGTGKRPKEDAIEIVIREPLRAEAPREFVVSGSD